MRRSRESSRSPGSSGGSPFEALVLTYEPFADPANMKRLLADLVRWVLEKRIHHRSASAVRGLLRAWIDIDLHEKVPELERRIEVLEKERGVKAA